MATGRPCKVCAHHQRADIDAALVAGAALVSISERFGLSRQSLIRHRDTHVPTQAMQEGAQQVAAAEGIRGGALLHDATGLRDTALTLLRKAEAAGDLRTALMGVREAARCLELMAKLAGEIEEGATVNLVLAPAFVTVQTTLLAALAPYPAARAAVVRALEGLR